jgi:hypothetical protein
VPFLRMLEKNPKLGWLLGSFRGWQWDKTRIQN